MAKSLSMEERINEIYKIVLDGLRSAGYISKDMNGYEKSWIRELFDNYVVVTDGEDEYTAYPYSIDANDSITFGDPVTVEETWVPVIGKSLKMGAAISQTNKSKLSKIREHQAEITKILDELDPAEDETKSIPETIVTYGKSVKATKLDNGDVKLGGYLVTFSDENNPDLEGDFFTKNTDFGEATKSDGWFHHCMPLRYAGKSIKYTSQLPDVSLTKDDVGVFAEIVLGSRNKYEKLLADLGMAGALSWSSGTAPNLITEKSHKNGSNEITRWKLGLDASLTPTPAEPMNRVIPLKSISDKFAELVDEPEAVDTAATDEPAIAIKSIKEHEMTPEEIQAMKDEINAGVKATVLEAMKAAPAPDSTGTQPIVEVVTDEGDRPFKSLAEMCKAVKDEVLTHGRSVDKRLLAIKAVLGASEAIPSDGGYTLNPTLTTELIKPMHDVGPFSNDVRKLPVSNDSNYGWINGIDETSRVDGSRWGGVQAYWLAEGGTKTASQPKFRRINWELKKIAALMYSTDELLADSAQFSAVANQSAGEEIAFKVNDAILEGDGVGKPLGILKSGSLIYVARDTASKVLHVDVLNMWQRLMPRYRANAKWYINSEVEAQLQQLYFTGTTSVLSPFVQYAVDGTMRIMGKPVVVTEFNPALNAAGDIVLADMSQYLMWEKGGVETASSIHVAFLTDQTAFRFVYRCDGQAAYDSPITPYKGSTTQSAFVTLGAATTTAA